MCDSKQKNKKKKIKNIFIVLNKESKIAFFFLVPEETSGNKQCGEQTEVVGRPSGGLCTSPGKRCSPKTVLEVQCRGRTGKKGPPFSNSYVSAKK